MQSRHTQHQQAGFTLIEVMIVVAIVALLLGGASYTIHNVTRADLRSAASRTAATMRFAFDRAMVTGSTIRLAIDMDKGELWLEKSEGSVGLRTGREQHVTTDAQEAESDTKPASSTKPLLPLGLSGTEDEGEDGMALGIDADMLVAAYERDLEPVQRPKALFEPLKGPETKRIKLNTHIRVTAVMSAHLDEPTVDGIGYVYFFPQGHAEPAIVHLTNTSEDTYSVVLRPLTGQARVYACRYRIPDEFGSEQDHRTQRDPCEDK